MIHEDATYLRLMYEAIIRIENFIDGNERESFIENEMMKQACLMQLVVIGENCGKISDELKAKFVDVEWRQIKDARNFYIHLMIL